MAAARAALAVFVPRARSARRSGRARPRLRRRRRRRSAGHGSAGEAAPHRKRPRHDRRAAAAILARADSDNHAQGRRARRKDPCGRSARTLNVASGGEIAAGVSYGALRGDHPQHRGGCRSLNTFGHGHDDVPWGRVFDNVRRLL
ncbi:MAG TPA: hypothetical protein VF505_13130 [Thermoanaerobaculia bacterium]